MTKKTSILSLLVLCLTSMTMIFSSCKKDEDEPNDTAYYDFSIIWEVVDKGGYSTSEAMLLVANLTDASENIFVAYTTAQAISDFNDFCEQMRYEFATDYVEITLRANLTRNEGNKRISTKTFYIKPEGTILKKPAKVADSDSVVVVE